MQDKHSELEDWETVSVVGDYNPSCESLASEMALLGQNQQEIQRRLDSMDERLCEMSRNIDRAIGKIDDRISLVLQRMDREVVHRIEHINTQVEAMRIRELREENLNLRRGIPFNFKPSRTDE